MYDWNEIKKATVKALKDHGIDWILTERQLNPNLLDKDFNVLVDEIILALKGVL